MEQGIGRRYLLGCCIALVALANPAGVPLAGDDKKALEVARQLVIDAGYEPVMAGDLKSAQIFDSYTPFHTTGMSASEVRKLLVEKPAPIFTK